MSEEKVVEFALKAKDDLGCYWSGVGTEDLGMMYCKNCSMWDDPEEDCNHPCAYLYFTLVKLESERGYKGY